MEEAPQKTESATDTHELVRVNWSGLIGPVPQPTPLGLVMTPHDRSRRISDDVTVGPLVVRAAATEFVEHARSEPVSLDGWSTTSSWPVVVEGTAEGVHSFAALRKGAEDLQRLCRLLSLAWHEPWQIRTAPRNREQYGARVPESLDHPNRRLRRQWTPDPVATTIPLWVEPAWNYLSAHASLHRALAVWHQGLMVESANPSLALVAYVGSLEQVVDNRTIRSSFKPELRVHREKAEGRFKAAVERFATNADRAALLSANAYRLRSLTAHGKGLHAHEMSYGALISLPPPHAPWPGDDNTDERDLHHFVLTLVPAARRTAAAALAEVLSRL